MQSYEDSSKNSEVVLVKLSRFQEIMLFQIKWVLLSSMIIAFIDTVFMITIDWISFSFDILLILNQVYTLFYVSSTFNYGLSDSDQFKTVVSSGLRMNIFFYLFLILFVVSIFWDNDSFFSYDEFDQYFIWVYIVLFVIKEFLLKYSQMLIVRLGCLR